MTWELSLEHEETVYHVMARGPREVQEVEPTEASTDGENGRQAPKAGMRVEEYSIIPGPIAFTKPLAVTPEVNQQGIS